MYCCSGAETPRSLPGEPRKPLHSTQHTTTSAQQPPRTETGSNPTGTKPHHPIPTQPTRQCRSTIPPDTSGRRANSQGKATKELSISPLWGMGALRTVPAHHAQAPKTSLREVSALLYACPVSFILPPLQRPFPLSFPACTKPFTFSSSAGQPASPDCRALLAAAAGLSLRQQPEGAARSYGAKRDAPPRPHGSGPGGTLPPR